MKRKFKMLDLCCGAGGCSMGYFLAGMDVTGVDLVDQPNYPFKFIKANALEIPLDQDTFDFYHASPPCQEHSKLHGLANHTPDQEDIIEEIRCRLNATGRPYIIENVPNAPLVNPVILRGDMFGLGVVRERWFESNIPMFSPGKIEKRIMGPEFRNNYVTVAGHGGRTSRPWEAYRYWNAAMAIGWMEEEELSEAIPWFYTLYLGGNVINYLKTHWPVKMS